MGTYWICWVAHSTGVEQPTRAILWQKHCGISMGTYWICWVQLMVLVLNNLYLGRTV